MSLDIDQRYANSIFSSWTDAFSSGRMYFEDCDLNFKNIVVHECVYRTYFRKWQSGKIQGLLIQCRRVMCGVPTLDLGREFDIFSF